MNNAEERFIVNSEIEAVLEGLTKLLSYKNSKYGNSAIDPPKVFSKLNSEEGIKIRLDDKIKRIQTSGELRKNDVVDLMGYLTLLCMQKGWTEFGEFYD